MRSTTWGFLKARNEVIREGNIYRALGNLERICGGGVLCDDASTDGTAEVLEDFVKRHVGEPWTLLRVAPEKQDFRCELEVKNTMLETIRRAALGVAAPRWIWWADADEVLDAEGTGRFHEWLDAEGDAHEAWRFHYTQLWRSRSWARTDDGFDAGEFVKLWRYRPDLTFDAPRGTHHPQFPKPIRYERTGLAPFDVIHYGNYGKNLQWKAHQYAGGLGGVDRHLFFGHAEPSLCTGVGFDVAYPAPAPTYRKVDVGSLPDFGVSDDLSLTVGGVDFVEPEPFPLEEVKLIRAMGNLREKAGWFTVVVPAYNRAKDLPAALHSLLAQQYPKWIAVVLDDGSTDATPGVMREWQDRDPRIFYARHPKNRGGVAMNEIGMALACEMTEYWTRLGSDDVFGPSKLQYDASALPSAGASWGACFGSYRVARRGQLAEACNPSKPIVATRSALRGGQFVASWANVAVRTSVLREVRRRWGNFVDPRLRNMEDFLANARIAQVTEFVWRGVVGGDFVVNPEAPGLHSEDLEAVWNCLEAVGAPADASASADAQATARDEELTRRLIAEMRSPS